MGMIGVTFGDKHSYDDWHVYLNGFSVEYPTPRRITVDVPLRNGVLDVTSALTGDRIYYENRKIKIDFKVIDNQWPWQVLYSKIASYLHGKSMHVIYDMDPYFYWDAYNCTISSPSANEDIGSFSIECDCYPYKKELDMRTASFQALLQANATKTLKIENLREEIVPTIRTTIPMTLIFNGSTYSLNTGSNVLTDVRLLEGTNELVFKKPNDGYTTDVTVTVVYRRGEL